MAFPMKPVEHGIHLLSERLGKFLFGNERNGLFSGKNPVDFAFLPSVVLFCRRFPVCVIPGFHGRLSLFRT